MKKLYRKGTVHPSPPVISDHLSFLPATILTLAAALSPEDREVLAYLIFCSSSSSSVNDFHGHRKNTTTHHNQKTVSIAKTRTICGGSGNSNDHPPVFNCDCFRCYMSYWVRWDNSPNRQLIHEIIDAFEEDQLVRNSNKKTKNNKKDKKKRGGGGGNDKLGELKRSSSCTDHHHQPSHELAELELAAENTSNSGGGGGGDDVEEVNTEKGPVRNFVSFIGEKIWGVWG